MTPTRSRSAALAAALFAGLLGIQLLLALAVPPGRWGGDEPGFVAKARYLFEHGRFRPIATPDPGPDAPDFQGSSDWRPPGYPLFLALVSGGRFDPAGLRPRLTLAQFAAVSLLLSAFLAVAHRAFGPSPLLVAWAVVLGLQPWAFGYVGSALSDPLSAVLSGAGLLGLLVFVESGSGGRAAAGLFLGTALSSAVLLVRPEAIAMAPVLVGTALLLAGPSRRHALRWVAIATLTFGSCVALQVAYRVSAAGRWELFGPVRLHDEGALRWVHTWLGTEKVAYEGFLYRLDDGRARLEDLPPRAFRDPGEREAVRAALAELSARGAYDREIDRVFSRLARERIRDDPLRYFVLPRLWRTGLLWVNLETNAQLLRWLTPVRRDLRRSILGLLLALKGALLALAGIALVGLFIRGEPRASSLARSFTVLCAVFVVSRTVLIGLVAGFGTHRHMLSAWPPLLWLALAGMHELAARIGARRGRPAA